MATKSPRAAPRNDTTAERLARLETVIEGLPGAIATAIRQELRDYTSRRDHDDLETRVDGLEKWHAENSGAARIQERSRDTFHSYLQQFSPYIITLFVMAYSFLHGGG